jgi:hypothetical protein
MDSWVKHGVTDMLDKAQGLRSGEKIMNAMSPVRPKGSDQERR